MTSTRQNDYQFPDPLDSRSRMQDEFSLRHLNWNRWVRARIQLQPSSRILELGCGTGAFWLAVHHPVSNHVRLLSDISPAMLKESRRLLQNSPACYSYLVADAINPPFADGRFDFILALGVLDHLPDVPAALRNIRRLMKQNARLAASTGAEDHLVELCRLIGLYSAGVRLGSASDQFTLENGKHVLKAFFRYVKSTEFIDSLVFPDARSVMAYIRSETNAIAALHGEERPLEQQIKEIIRRNGPLVVRTHKVLFEAQI